MHIYSDKLGWLNWLCLPVLNILKFGDTLLYGICIPAKPAKVQFFPTLKSTEFENSNHRRKDTLLLYWSCCKRLSFEIIRHPRQKSTTSLRTQIGMAVIVAEFRKTAAYQTFCGALNMIFNK